jgi:putative restriction endonuclease
VADIDWEDRVAHIRAWQRDGVRAPHKPLLLLYALGRLQGSGLNAPLPFSEAEGPLNALLADFGRPTSARTSTNAGYPFHHLTSDGLWIVSTAEGVGSPGSKLGLLRSSRATGELDPGFAAAMLADPELLTRIARSLLDTNFPPTLHEEIAERVGLDLAAAADADREDVPERGRDSKMRRSSEFRDNILLAYERRCAMCGWDARLGTVVVGLEAAHVRWFNIGGPDEPANGLCLCSLHHKLFDRGVMGLTSDHTVAVSAHFVGGGSLAKDFVLALLGNAVAEPLAGFPSVADEHIAWHTSEVFRSPARLVA